MNFWTELVWVGNRLYPRWFCCAILVLCLLLFFAASYGGFRFLKFLFDLVRGPNA